MTIEDFEKLNLALASDGTNFRMIQSDVHGFVYARDEECREMLRQALEKLAVIEELLRAPNGHQ